MAQRHPAIGQSGRTGSALGRAWSAVREAQLVAPREWSRAVLLGALREAP
jgi:hypothetical protein